MDLASRKLAFLRSFLQLEDEGIISNLEKVLNGKQNHQESFSSMTKERLNNEIDVALEDSKNKRLIEHKDLKRKMKSLR